MGNAAWGAVREAPCFCTRGADVRAREAAIAEEASARTGGDGQPLTGSMLTRAINMDGKIPDLATEEAADRPQPAQWPPLLVVDGASADLCRRALCFCPSC